MPDRPDDPERGPAATNPIEAEAEAEAGDSSVLDGPDQPDEASTRGDPDDLLGDSRAARRSRQRARRRARRGDRVARVLGGVGRTLITSGLLILLFVAYQLWGTGLYTAQQQEDLKNDFRQALAAVSADTTVAATTTTRAPVSTTSAPRTTGTTRTGPTATTEPETTSSTLPPAPPTAERGEPTALMRIERLDLEVVVVEGVGRDDLKKGPGHYPETPLPGQYGNAAIAGHRTTNGSPFGRLDELEIGDEIVVETLAGEFTYRVTTEIVVDPSEVGVLAPPPDPRAAILTLTTCHPRFSARQRLVIQAVLVADASPPPSVFSPTTATTPTDEIPGDDPSDTQGSPDATTATGDDTPPDDGSPGSLGSGPSAGVEAGAEAPAIDDGELFEFQAPGGAFYVRLGLAALVGLGWWIAFRRWTRWFVWLGGVAPFLVVLFLFYVQLEKVLPAGY